MGIINLGLFVFYSFYLTFRNKKSDNDAADTLVMYAKVIPVNKMLMLYLFSFSLITIPNIIIYVFFMHYFSTSFPILLLFMLIALDSVYMIVSMMDAYKHKNNFAEYLKNNNTPKIKAYRKHRNILC